MTTHRTPWLSQTFPPWRFDQGLAAIGGLWVAIACFGWVRSSVSTDGSGTVLGWVMDLTESVFRVVWIPALLFVVILGIVDAVRARAESDDSRHLFNAGGGLLILAAGWMLSDYVSERTDAPQAVITAIILLGASIAARPLPSMRAARR